jgi:hypothetical protein
MDAMLDWLKAAILEMSKYSQAPYSSTNFIKTSRVIEEFSGNTHTQTVSCQSQAIGSTSTKWIL